MDNQNNQALQTQQGSGGMVLDIEKQFPSDKFNRLCPSDTIMVISPLQRVTIEVLTVSTNPNDREIFKIGSRKVGGHWEDLYSLSKPTLDRFSLALGISWIPEETRRVDDRSNNNRIEFKAVGVYKSPDGSVSIISGYKEIDLNAMEEEMLVNYQEKAMNGNLVINKIKHEWGTKECEEVIAFQVRKAMVAKRKFKVPLAESGAKNRAIRSMGIKSSYTLKELQKPFIVPRFNFDPSVLMNDPVAKKRLLDNSMMSAKMLYGETPRFYANGDDTVIEGNFEQVQQTTEEAKTETEENKQPAIETSENGQASESKEAEEPKLTDDQRKAIFANANQYWGKDANTKLHKGVKKQYGKGSVNDLTDTEAKKVIAGLKKALQEKDITPDDLIRVAKKAWKTDQLETVQNLNAIVNKRYKVPTIDNLTPKQISLVISRIEEGKDTPVLEPVSTHDDDDSLPFDHLKGRKE